MAPEEPGNLVLVDLQLEADELIGHGERISPNDFQWLTVSWYAKSPPEGSLTIGNGVAYVYDAKKVKRREIPNTHITKMGDGFRWRDTARGDGLMFILVLPAGQTIQQPRPLPVEAKVFNGRVAIYWLPPDTQGKRIHIDWQLHPFNHTVEEEVLHLNNLILKAEEEPHNRGVTVTEVPDETIQALHLLMKDRFDLNELQTLCIYLGIDYEEFGANNKSGKIRELLLYLKQRNQIPQLIQKGQTLRPDITNWPDME